MHNPFEELVERLDRIEKLLTTKQTSTPKPEQPDWLTLDQAIKYLEKKHGLPYKKSKVYKGTMNGDIPCSRAGKRLVFSRQKLAEWAENQIIPKQPAKDIMSRKLAS